MRNIGSKLFVLAALLVVAACGSDTGDAGAPDDTVDSNSSTSTTSTDAPVSSTDAPDSGTDPASATTDAPGTTEAPLGGGDLPIATLEITISHPEFDDVTYTISCLGDTATIIGDVAELEAVTACQRLGDAEVRQRLVTGPKKEIACTEQYGGPDVARIVGTYDGVDGVKVDATVDRINGCAISDWDNLLAGVLPRAVGVVQ